MNLLQLLMKLNSIFFSGKLNATKLCHCFVITLYINMPYLLVTFVKDYVKVQHYWYMYEWIYEFYSYIYLW